MSKQSRANNAAARNWGNQLGNPRTVEEQTQAAKNNHSRLWHYPWPRSVSVALGVAPVAALIIFSPQIVSALNPDENYQEWSFTNDPSSGTDKFNPPARMTPHYGDLPVKTLGVGQREQFNICKGVVFIDKDRKTQIHDPIVDTLSGDNSAVFPRHVSLEADNSTITVGQVEKPKNYEWRLGNNETIGNVPFCAGQWVVAKQFSNGPHKNDTLRLAEEGIASFPDSPWNGPREGVAAVQVPIK
jgi:hypothetical protein